MSEKDPYNVEQHAIGAKLDLEKPAPLLCLTDFAPALRQLVGLQCDFLRAEAIEECCAAGVIDDILARGKISSQILLASMIVVQSQAARVDSKILRLESVPGIVSSFSEALLAISKLTAVGARKYRPSGWKVVPDGINRYSEACLRHFLKSFSEEIDRDSGATHWCCVAWNSAAVLTLADTPEVSTT